MDDMNGALVVGERSEGAVEEERSAFARFCLSLRSLFRCFFSSKAAAQFGHSH